MSDINPNFPEHKTHKSTVLTLVCCPPFTPLTQTLELSELPATWPIKTLTYCSETVHFYSADRGVTRGDKKFKKKSETSGCCKRFLKAQFFWSYECNRTERARSERKESRKDGWKRHESKELFTILNFVHVLVCQNSINILCVYMEFPVTFFSAECIILLLYTWKYKIYFIKNIYIHVCGGKKTKVLFVCRYLISEGCH